MCLLLAESCLWTNEIFLIKMGCVGETFIHLDIFGPHQFLHILETFVADSIHMSIFELCIKMIYFLGGGNGKDKTVSYKSNHCIRLDILFHVFVNIDKTVYRYCKHKYRC